MAKTFKSRNEINDGYKWSIEDMYPDEKKWQDDLSRAVSMAGDYGDFAGRLAESSGTFLASLKLRDELWQVLEKVYVYARMRRDEDNREEKYQAMCDQAMAAMARVSALSSFSTPEILAAGEEKIMGFIAEEPELSPYRFAMENTFRMKDHVLTGEEENIMAQMSEVTSATEDIFTMLNNADLKFGTVADEEGNHIELTHGNYITFMESHDRRVREDAFSAMYRAYQALINTIASAYNYNTKTDVVSARIRKYDSARSAALSGDNIPGEVYDNLVKEVNRNLPSLHKYIGIRKRLLKVDDLKMHDVYVPLFPVPKKEISYEEGLEIMKKGLSPLGEEYISHLSQGLDERWVDVYESEGKTSGAYSFGSYDSKPYVLLNYTDTLKDVFTIAHEMGHSMHSFYTRRTQPFLYGGHSIFTAEVASTVNENLLMKHLLAEEKDPDMKKYLLNMHIESFRTTLFRQTMFAEFENMTHSAVEEGIPLTPQWLCHEYGKLNEKYFGDALTEDPFIQYEWARIPHFYRAFYVYKYATGYSAAAAISDIILKSGPDDYLRFLTTGESDYPIRLLKIAGVDMSTPAPVEAAMKTFGKLVDELDQLV